MRANIRLVDYYLNKYGMGTGGTMEARVDRLERLMRAHNADGETQMAHCDICDHVSDAILTECPFCGDGSGIEGKEDDKEKPDNKIVHMTTR
jgi:hypothetical protein